MNNPKDLARWMLEQLGDRSWLHQQSLAFRMKRDFGEENVYRNKNGNWAIHKDILAEFRKLTEDMLVWSRSNQAWRKRREGDPPGRMVR